MDQTLLHAGEATRPLNVNRWTIYRCWLCLVMCFGSISQVVSSPHVYAGFSHSEQASSEGKTYAFVNGQWFDGQRFLGQTFYSVDGILTRTNPSVVDEVIDLENGFVVPPFGEAHNHNVEGPWNVDDVVQRYLKDGVFYVKIPGNIGEFTDRIRRKINVPASIDVVFSNGGLTATGGHPAPLYEEVLSLSRYAPVLGHLEKGWFKNRAYFLIDSESDLQRKWKMIIAGKPDFIKTFLAHSEAFSRHQGASSPNAHTGLNPTLLPVIVDTAHREGLRVSAHVETAADFRHAVRAGVDEIAHLPGWWIPTPNDQAGARLTEDDARRAAAAGVVVVTTTVAGQSMPGHTIHSAHGSHQKGDLASSHSPSHQLSDLSVREVQKDNLQLLHRHGVRIAIGSDHADTSLMEAMNLWSLKIFDNLTLLKMWCETTPATIFLDRRIGHLEEGYEASFLVLAKNPLERFDHVKDITMRVKQGHVLTGQP